ncbi:MAG: aspartate kinase [Candidatus Bathyarchaeota archaeon]
MNNNIFVVKFGGSCLSSPETIISAAKKISSEVATGKKIIVVVSALSGVTDQLISLAEGSTKTNISREDLDDIVSMGERTAVRLMTSSLKSLNVKTLGIEPNSPYWPIFTDSIFGNADVNLKKTSQVVHEKIIPLLDQGWTLVIAGFIGLSSKGKITTLGRGGSDITAVLLGNCLDAEEVIFVKDVAGVLSADPKKVSGPQKIDQLMVEEAYTLASAGAKIIQPKALTFKKNSTVLRVVGFESSDLGGGTVIMGELKTALDAELHDSPLSMITLIAQNGSLSKISKVLSEVSKLETDLLGLTVSLTSLLLYVQNPLGLVQSLHEKIKTDGIAKAIHCVDSLAMIVVSGYRLESIPGVIDAVVSPLAKANINLYGVFTISSSIRIFIQWNDREKALALINYVLNKFREGEDG